jgi:hypothetical protein
LLAVADIIFADTTPAATILARFDGATNTTPTIITLADAIGTGSVLAAVIRAVDSLLARGARESM